MDSEDKKIMARLRDLKKEREGLLAIPPEAALERLLSHKNALAVVHSFPAEDLHLLIRGIGADDALPLLAMASNRQWEYILDIETWRKDRMDFAAATEWLKLLLSADPVRLAEWCATEKDMLVDFFLLHNIEVRIREYDESPSQLGDDFVTFDDTFYFRILDPPFSLESDADPEALPPGGQSPEDRKDFLMQLLRRLANFDHHRFQDILLESMSVISAETEEELYRRRNVRLAEKGFLPFEEAVGIYQPLAAKELKRRIKKLRTEPAEYDRFMPVPYSARNLLEPDNAFAKALASVKNENVLTQLQTEFAGLCNQLLTADQKIIAGRSGLHDAVKKASGYIGIGLETIPEDGHKQLERYLLADIFRVGYGMALALKRRADQWRQKSWFTAKGLSLSFWDEEWMGVIGGLLVKRPLCYDRYQSGTFYREFATHQDIVATEAVLTEIMAFDELLGALSLEVSPLPAASLLTYKNLLLTHWARETIGSGAPEPALAPLPLDAFKSFFNTLWHSPKKPKTIKLAVKSAFLKWLAERSGLSGVEITGQCGKTLEALFAEIETELGRVSEKDIDPRFIQLFIIA